MKSLRQGDVLLTPSSEMPSLCDLKPLPHLVLAEGEVTGHKHQISQGQAELFEENGVLYLVVSSETATLTHEEHQPLPIQQGLWIVKRQREYVAEPWREVPWTSVCD